MAKQLRLMIALMFAGILIYSGLWFTAAFDAEQKATALFSTWRDQGLQVEHGKITHGGFPYRITVTVEDISVKTRQRGLDFSAKELVAVTHLWTPGHWVTEAHGVEASLARGSVRFTDNFMHASYREYEDGMTVIAIAPNSTDDMTLLSFFGKEQATPDDWHFYIRLGGEGSNTESSLYGTRFLDFKFMAKSGTTNFETLGGFSGPAVRDWSKKELAHWRDEGGLVELDSIDFSVAGGRTKGSASLTLDQDFRLIGSANLFQNGNSHLHHLFNALGVESLGLGVSTGPASLMLQHGTVRLNGEPLAALEPVID